MATFVGWLPRVQQSFFLPGFLSLPQIVVLIAVFFFFFFFVTQNIRTNARKERILPPDEIEDLQDDDSDFLKPFQIKSKTNFFFPDSFNILTINNKNMIKTKKKTNISIKTIISVMTAKKKERKKVMEEKQPSFPEVVTVWKHPRIPGVTLNRLRISLIENETKCCCALSKP